MAFSDITESGVILGQNCVRLTDAALNDLFFSNLFYQKQYIYAMNIGVAQVRSALLYFLGKKYLFISLLDAAFNF